MLEAWVQVPRELKKRPLRQFIQHAPALPGAKLVQFEQVFVVFVCHRFHENAQNNNNLQTHSKLENRPPKKEKKHPSVKSRLPLDDPT